MANRDKVHKINMNRKRSLKSQFNRDDRKRSKQRRGKDLWND